MSIPVIPEHSKEPTDCEKCPHDEACIKKYVDEGCPKICAPDCPRCLAIKWAQWLVEKRITSELAAISAADWRVLKGLAEEKVNG